MEGRCTAAAAASPGVTRLGWQTRSWLTHTGHLLCAQHFPTNEPSPGRRAEPLKPAGCFSGGCPLLPPPALSPHLAGRHTRWEKHCWEDCAESPREVRPGRKPRIWHPSPCCTAGNEAQRREISLQVRRGSQSWDASPAPTPGGRSSLPLKSHVGGFPYWGDTGAPKTAPGDRGCRGLVTSPGEPRGGQGTLPQHRTQASVSGSSLAPQQASLEPLSARFLIL